MAGGDAGHFERVAAHDSAGALAGVGRGVVAETIRGEYVIKPGFAQQDEVLELLARAMDETVLFFNACLDKSLLVFEDE